MKKINVRKEYKDFSSDKSVEVENKVFESIKNSKNEVRAQNEKITYHKSYYSLNLDDGIEFRALFQGESPEEIYEKKLANKQLYKAILKLSKKQARRIYAYYFLDMSKAQIARLEGVSKASVGESIERGLANIEKILLNFKK